MNKWYKEIEELFRNGINPESRLFANRYAQKARGFIDKTMKGIDQEAEETRDMASSFFRLLEHKLNLNDRTDPPSKEEVKAAIEQLKDVGRYSVFVTAVILPGGVFSLIGLEVLAKKYGIQFSFIPSAFRNQKKDPENKQNSPPKDHTESDLKYPPGSGTEQLPENLS